MLDVRRRVALGSRLDQTTMISSVERPLNRATIMDIAGVREALHKQPLQPFIIRLADGRALPVRYAAPSRNVLIRPNPACKLSMLVANEMRQYPSAPKAEPMT